MGSTAKKARNPPKDTRNSKYMDGGSLYLVAQFYGSDNGNEMRTATMITVTITTRTTTMTIPMIRRRRRSRRRWIVMIGHARDGGDDDDHDDHDHHDHHDHHDDNDFDDFDEFNGDSLF